MRDSASRSCVRAHSLQRYRSACASSAPISPHDALEVRIALARRRAGSHPSPRGTVSIAVRSGAACAIPAATAANTSCRSSPMSRICATAASTASSASRRSAPTRRDRCGSSSCSRFSRLAQRRAQQPLRELEVARALRDLRTQHRGARKRRSLLARLAQETACRVDRAAFDRERRELARILRPRRSAAGPYDYARAGGTCRAPARHSCWRS